MTLRIETQAAVAGSVPSSVMRGLLALALLLGIAACDKSPTPPASTTPPAVTPPAADPTSGPVARIAVAADDLGSLDAIVALSQVMVDASASTGAGSVTYVVDFGDGTTTTDPVARHIYEAPGRSRLPASCVMRAAGRRRRPGRSWRRR